jgi:hypothetical protein
VGKSLASAVGGSIIDYHDFQRKELRSTRNNGFNCVIDPIALITDRNDDAYRADVHDSRTGGLALRVGLMSSEMDLFHSDRAPTSTGRNPQMPPIKV